MKQMLFILSFCLPLLFALEFSVVQKGESLDDNNTILIFGGIQGDEPGGFHAASLLISDYNITKGKIIVAPNLAFDSIIKRSRGTNGDLNRKFAKLNKDDPDYETIQRIKELILLPEVSMVINLHDGWGFYRPYYINAEQNPKRWGNSSVIDTREINASKYSELEKIALSTIESVNSSLIDPKHQYFLKNTKTEELADSQMLKALTYFVISNHKAAFANEASKNLPTHLRAYYHLVALEHYLKTAGIEFERNFELNPQGVKKAIEKELFVKLFRKKILLELNKPRASINYLPFPLYWDYDYETSNELTAVIAQSHSFFIQYGNRFQTRIYPEYFEFSNAFNEFPIIIDGQKQIMSFANKIKVKNNFLIPPINKVRVNIIGLDLRKDESGVLVSKDKMQSRYSLDTAGKIFRVEFYELRGANLSEQVSELPSNKNIKNPPLLSPEIYNTAKKKDKFIGSILVEFE